MITDPIGDMLTRIRNALRAKHSATAVPHSRIKERIAAILCDEGFLAGYRVEGDAKKSLVLTLKYADDRRPVIQRLERVSAPGLRRYAGADGLSRVRAGLGIAILSTSRGVIVDREARKARVGGELLCRIW